MNFHPFVIPFSAGLIFLILAVICQFAKWINHLPKEDKSKLRKGFFSAKIFNALNEFFMEGLIHRKIFRQNILHGYMHMSFAFGWFLLIVIGNLETRLHSGSDINPPYYPIFFKFFEHNSASIPFEGAFSFIMDLILLLIVISVFIALFKRISSKIVGVKKRAKRKLTDKLALTSLWLIFPLRLLAESFSAGMYQNGGFVTGTIGDFFASLFPLHNASLIAWWGYSFALGTFFIFLPFSRYMHIPTEILLISLRHIGLKQQYDFNSFSDVQVHSCPRCGLCIDKCQLHTATAIDDVQSVYFLRNIREGKVEERILNDCLLCGRCQEYCPVGIDTTQLRIAKRKENFNNRSSDLNYLLPQKIVNAEVIYFAGCMSHLTPSIKKSMVGIFEKAKINYYFMDADGGACCGRPMMMSGDIESAKKLIAYNKDTIINSGAKTLVTSCPICYKVFKEDYQLDIEVLHHSQYLLRLTEEGRISLNKLFKRVIYHDPCELGRGSKVYEEPRKLLQQTVDLIKNKFQEENSLCCGGSLGDTVLTQQQRDKITNDTLNQLSFNKPDAIVTACPLCKKTFVKNSDLDILDISEIVIKAMMSEPYIFHGTSMTPDSAELKGLDIETNLKTKEKITQQVQ